MAINGKKLWKKVPGIIRHDFVRKMISLFLACIVYLAVMDKMGVEREIFNVTVKIPESVVLQTLPESLNLIKIDGKAPVVKLRVKGSDRILKRLTENDFRIDDLAFSPEAYQPGVPYRLKLLPGDVKGPSGVQILSVDPSVIPVDFDILQSKMVEVKPVFETRDPLPAGYVVSRTTVSPTDVRVTGPKQLLDKLGFLQTKPIPLGAIRQAFDYNAEIQLSTPALKVSPASVFVQIDIEKNIGNRTFSMLPLLVLNDNSKFSYEFLTAPRVEVSLTGAKALLDNLKKDNVKAYVDISSLNQPGIYTVDIGCWVTENSVEVKTILPSAIKIKIFRK